MPERIELHLFFHSGETAKLTEISALLQKLILLHGGEAQLKKAADKLNISTEALAEALQDQNPPTPTPTKE
jgi:hypothetical protein